MKFIPSPPPHIGWWYTSDIIFSNAWRWWNGEGWSVGCHSDYSNSEVAQLSAIPSVCENHEIQWSTYYPKNARVPRRKP